MKNTIIRRRLRNDIDKLREETKKSNSIAELTQRMGYNMVGCLYERLREVFNEYNIPTEHFTGQGWSKGKSALTDERIGKPIEEIFCENSKVARGYVKQLIEKHKLKDYKCDGCGLTSWKDSPINLHLDHINGKNRDHRLENLRFLCPNCHSQTSTYCKGVQNRYTDEEIFKASVGAKSIREVMVSIGMTDGTNYKRVKRLLPNLVKKKFIESKLEIIEDHSNRTPKNKSKEWLNKIAISNRKVKVRPTKEELQKLVDTNPLTSIGKIYKVSDNSIKKWCKTYGIQTKPRGYWAKIYSQK